MPSFADRLKKIRNGKNTKEFAARVGISSGTLSRYENGESSPSLKLASRIAERTGTSLEWLLHGSEKKEAAPSAAVKAENQQPAISGCQQCFELYNKLVKSQESEIALILENAALKVIEKEFRAQEQTIKSLEEQNLLQAEAIEQLQQQLSLSANADVKPPQTSAA